MCANCKSLCEGMRQSKSSCWARIVFTLFVEMPTRVCPVQGIDGQVPICGRCSRGTISSQQPGEVASVSDRALMLWRA
jgi:predicted PP-loop superfamily ATPase